MGSDLNVVLSVGCSDGILLTKPKASELPHQIDCLLEAAGRSGASEVLVLYLDDPKKFDKPSLYKKLCNIKCVCKDAMHIALNVEKAFRGKKNKLSVALRRCVAKFGHAHDDNKRYFKHGMVPLSYLSNDVVAATSPELAKRRVAKIAADFVRDTLQSIT